MTMVVKESSSSSDDKPLSGNDFEVLLEEFKNGVHDQFPGALDDDGDEQMEDNDGGEQCPYSAEAVLAMPEVGCSDATCPDSCPSVLSALFYGDQRAYPP